MLTPTGIANELGIDPKALRRFIRKDPSLKRPETQKAERYEWSRAQADEIKRRYRAQ